MTATRIAFVVSHPIQYYAPLYRRLSQSPIWRPKVFFTWHDGKANALDHGFRMPVTWDIPVTEGYEFELVANSSPDPGTHHFWGLRNPELIRRMESFKPDLVHVTGWAWASHMSSLRHFHRHGVRTAFRGDSHLLGRRLAGAKWHAKRSVLKRVFSWADVCLYVGSANRDYYKAFGVPDDRLVYCPHCIDVKRFSEPAATLDRAANELRLELGISEQSICLLFAGKLDRNKRPIELMQAVTNTNIPNVVLLVVGSGPLEQDVLRAAQASPARFKLLPFQNQSRMPIIYRAADLFVLPSVSETWGLAVNEALASGRPALVSDAAGCVADMKDGKVVHSFRSDMSDIEVHLRRLCRSRGELRALESSALKVAGQYDISSTETALANARITT
jgi:glycosyltransferase involved in cell wall biosynthesis